MSKKEHVLTSEQWEKVKHLIEEKEQRYKALEDHIGGIVFIRTVTHFYTGRVKNITGKFIVLENATRSWSGSGRGSA